MNYIWLYNVGIVGIIIIVLSCYFDYYLFVGILLLLPLLLNLLFFLLLGARIQTVSGIRGQIKKAVGKTGLFRATFEDKILMSDIVVCKAWIQVEPKEFWNPLLDVPNWKRIRVQAEIRNGNDWEKVL